MSSLNAIKSFLLAKEAQIQSNSIKNKPWSLSDVREMWMAWQTRLADADIRFARNGFLIRWHLERKTLSRRQEAEHQCLDCQQYTKNKTSLYT